MIARAKKDILIAVGTEGKVVSSFTEQGMAVVVEFFLNDGIRFHDNFEIIENLEDTVVSSVPKNNEAHLGFIHPKPCMLEEQRKRAEVDYLKFLAPWIKPPRQSIEVAIEALRECAKKWTDEKYQSATDDLERFLLTY